MTNVIDLIERRPHYSGQCSCLKCAREWTGVVPVGTNVLECPSCGAMSGVTFGAREVRLLQALEQIATGTSGHQSDDAVIMRDVAKNALASEKYGNY